MPCNRHLHGLELWLAGGQVARRLQKVPCLIEVDVMGQMVQGSFVMRAKSKERKGISIMVRSDVMEPASLVNEVASLYMIKGGPPAVGYRGHIPKVQGFFVLAPIVRRANNCM